MWTAATCTTSKTCSICHKTEGVPTGHNVVEWTILSNATCGTSGAKTGTCSICTETVRTLISKTGNHTYGEWNTVVQPTCTATGRKERVCSSCQHKDNESIATLDHNYVESIVVEVTCYKPGTKGEKCTVCGATGKTTEYYTYNKTTLKAIFDEYRANGMAAEENYRYGMYIEFTGKISSIEPGGLLSYGTVIIEVSNGSLWKDEVKCAIKSSEQQDYIKTLSAGNNITIKGLLTSVTFDSDYLINYMYINIVESIEGVRVLTPHCCRHTFVSMMRMNEVDISVLKAFTGHTQTKMVDHYTHVRDSACEAASAKLAAAFPLDKSFISDFFCCKDV